MAKEKTHFIRQVFDYMYPAKNRVIAAVAFVRTFKQTFTGAFTVGGAGLITISATDIAQLNWDIVLATAIALFLSAILSAAVAFDDVSRNGLNSKYMDAANPPAPAVTVDPVALNGVIKQLRPSFFVPAPAEAPKVEAKKTARKTAAKPKATAAANKVVENTMKANQAPAVEEPM
jgi:hypothetical protein